MPRFVALRQALADLETTLPFEIARLAQARAHWTHGKAEEYDALRRSVEMLGEEVARITAELRAESGQA